MKYKDVNYIPNVTEKLDLGPSQSPGAERSQLACIFSDVEIVPAAGAFASARNQLFSHVRYIHFDTIDSTNTWAKANAYSFDKGKLTCITALEQTAGRGRFLRKWLSPKGQNIYATLFFTIPTGSSYLPNIGQVLALSCIKILKSQGFNAQIKWPNDILIEEKKVAGILAETVPLDGCTGIVLGIGININMSEELLKTLDQPATSLAQLLTKTWKLEQILEPLIHQFKADFEILQQNGFSPFYEEFDKKLAFKGKEIACNDGIRIVKGICHSITPDGRLLLRLSTGELVTIMAGDVKFR